MPRLRLPPMPPPTALPKAFPKSMLLGAFSTQTVGNAGNREAAHRWTVSNPTIANKFVRRLGLRKNEVVFDAYDSTGVLARAFLAGGYDETTAADWAKVQKTVPKEVLRLARVGKVEVHDPYFPTWDPTIARKTELPEVPEEVITPSLVIVQENWVAPVCRSMCFPQPEKLVGSSKTQSEVFADSRIFQNPLEDKLLLNPSSVYLWDTLPTMLKSERIQSQLEVVDPSKEGVERYLRPWDAPAPPITLAATLHDSAFGDQLVNQWISSCIGSADGTRTWIWKWGRVRLALLVSTHTYDRLFAQPGEQAHNKLSVMCQALFDIRPLPPYHHVPDIDKTGKNTSTAYDPLGLLDVKKPRHRKRAAWDQSRPAPPPIDEVTATDTSDFFMIAKSTQTVQQVPPKGLARPQLLGIELIPKANSPIVAEQRDMWDFVLRKCFIRESQTLEDNIVKAAFGAENLLERFAEPKEGSRYAGEPVIANQTTPRDMSTEQWARVVDVFDKWAFKPENLLVDLALGDDSRQIGIS